MRPLTIWLDTAVDRQLRERATRQRRKPGDEAAVLLAQLLDPDDARSSDGARVGAENATAAHPGR
jgi:hypothetical protein